MYIGGNHASFPHDCIKTMIRFLYPTTHKKDGYYLYVIAYVKPMPEGEHDLSKYGPAYSTIFVNDNGNIQVLTDPSPALLGLE